MVNGKKVILAIDDVALNLNRVRTILSQDYDVRTAKSAEVALFILGSLEVDLILLDIEMPGGMSGFDFLDILHELPQELNIPVIMVTAHSNVNNIVRAQKAGVLDYIVKPYDTDTLTGKVRHALGEEEEGAEAHA